MTYTPFDVDAISPPTQPEIPEPVTYGGGFLFIGTGMNLDAFRTYIQAYDFGVSPPCFVVLHHTSVPDTQAARVHPTSQTMWDAGETGLSEQAIYEKRYAKLCAIRNYYRDSLGWDRGPHLFIDDRWIWLFTPMYYPGIHAAEGNGTERAYSIGIEVIGHYEHVTWPAPVARNVGGAIALLQQRLKTFEIVHRVGPGGISGHRDYNKPACPGAAITNTYYLDVITREAQRLNQPTSGPVQPGTQTATRVLGVCDQRISRERFAGVIQRRRFGLSSDEANRVYDLCVDLNICAAFVVALALSEQGAYLSDSSVYQATRNPGNMIWYPGTPYRKQDWKNGRTYRVFESAQMGMMTLVLHLKDAYAYALRLTTVEEIIPVYMAHTNQEHSQRLSRILIDMQAMTDLVV